VNAADAVVTLTPGGDWAAGFREASGGRGVDLVVDPVWGEPAVAALRAAAPKRAGAVAAWRTRCSTGEP
jgi:NADPH:quinone reductase-like Zn-dependent oxidoreductase